MKITPWYKLRKELSTRYKEGKLSTNESDFLYWGEAVERLPRKTMVLALNGLVFPAGTPTYLTISGVRITILRGEVTHFHTIWDGKEYHRVANEWLPHGYAIAQSRRLGKGRRALRRVLTEYPPVDPCAQAHKLRKMVREGD